MKKGAVRPGMLFDVTRAMGETDTHWLVIAVDTFGKKGVRLTYLRSRFDGSIAITSTVGYTDDNISDLFDIVK